MEAMVPWWGCPSYSANGGVCILVCVPSPHLKRYCHHILNRDQHIPRSVPVVYIAGRSRIMSMTATVVVSNKADYSIYKVRNAISERLGARLLARKTAPGAFLKNASQSTGAVCLLWYMRITGPEATFVDTASVYQRNQHAPSLGGIAKPSVQVLKPDLAAKWLPIKDSSVCWTV